MSDRVTNETSLRLEAAGFPQPEIAIGQFWYAETEYKGGEYEHNPLCVVVEAYSTRTKHLRRLTCEKGTGEAGGAVHVFAPTATDILKELQNHLLVFNGDKWVVVETATGEYLSDYCDNPAEACAAAWLEINEKK